MSAVTSQEQEILTNVNTVLELLGKGEFIKAMDEVNDIYFDAEQKLRMAVENHIQLITREMDKAHVFVNEWRRLAPADLKEFIALRDHYETGFEVIVENGENEGLFNEGDKK